jgi:hypothetical protein
MLSFSRLRLTAGALALVVPGVLVALPAPAGAAPADPVGAPVFDPPTQTSLGLQLPVLGQVSYSATVAVRFRQSGTQSWHDGLPLLRVRPETVHRQGGDPPEQFAGSIFGLRPATSYDVDLHLVGSGLDLTRTAVATTKAIPADPSPATVVNVYDDSAVAGPGEPAKLHLTQALQQARPSSVLVLHPGHYQGPFSLINYRAGDEPIVVRGTDRDGVVLDGGGSASPVLDVYGGHVHVENLTLRGGERGVRFLGGTYGGVSYPAVENVVRGVHVTDTNSGVTTQDPLGYNGDYICDNVLEGRTARGRHWVDATPGNPNPDNSPANYQGVMVGGGSTVCHNTISGYGDALHVTQQETHNTRATDFYGNDVRWTFDNGVETDGSEGNVRVFRNRFLNTYMPMSFQPVFGGPVYAFGNVIVNAYSEPLKFHGDAGTLDNSNGVLVMNNTIVKPGVPLPLATDARSANFRIENNLFIGGADATQTVDWHPQFDYATFDYNAYSPAGSFRFGGTTYPDLAAAQSAGYERNGHLLAGADVFDTLRPWSSWDTYAEPGVDASLAATSPGRNLAVALPNINDAPDGHPDLGAIEYGCAAPVYGVRPAGQDENNEPNGCTPVTQPSGGAPVTWTSLRNARADGATLSKSGGAANSQDSGGLSQQTVTGDVNALEFSWTGSSSSGCVGLGEQNTDTTCAIAYRLVLQPHDGKQLATAYDGTGYLGDTYYGPGDRLRITSTGGSATFARVTGTNISTFATSTLPPPSSLWADASLWDPGSAVGAATLLSVAASSQSARSSTMQRSSRSGPGQ